MKLPKPTVHKVVQTKLKRGGTFSQLSKPVHGDFSGPLHFLYTGKGDEASVPPTWRRRETYVSEASFEQMLEAAWSLCSVLQTHAPALLSTLSGVADLMQPHVFAVLVKAFGANGRRTSSYESRALRKMQQIAREILALPQPVLDALSAERAKLVTVDHQMSERTREALMPYLRKPERIFTLFDLPPKLVEEAHGKCPRYALAGWQRAVALSLTLDALVSPVDLRAMRRENLIVPIDPERPVEVLIPHPAAASFAINAPLSAQSSEIVRGYLAFLRNTVGLATIDHLFVALDGHPLKTDVSVYLAAIIKEATGFPLSLEQIVALVVALYVRANPRDFETPKRALGLRDKAGFTERFSAILTMAAVDIAVAQAEAAIAPAVLYPNAI